MRLAIIRQRYTPYGGAERFVESALEALLERSVAISLYTRQWPDTRLQLIEPVICNPFYIGRLWRDWSFARAVCKAVSSSDAQLVQSHERLICCDVYRAGDGVHREFLEQRIRHASAWERLRLRLSPYHGYVQAVEARLFASPWLRAVICNSPMVRDEIRTRYGMAENRLHVIYNAVDCQVFSPDLRKQRDEVLTQLQIPLESTVFLLVGSGYERKGVATAIQALAELPHHAHLIVVGKDKAIGRYRRLARRLNVASRVCLLGPQADPTPFFGAADCFVLPTLYDPCPNAGLEAMACGLPVITSTKSGVADLLREHACGLVCAARDAGNLAAHMQTLMDAETRAAMGTRARRAAEALTPENMTLKLVLLYRELLTETLPPAVSREAPANTISENLPVLGRTQSKRT